MSGLVEDLVVLVVVVFVMVASFVVPWPLGIIAVLVMMPRTVNRYLDRRGAKRVVVP